MPNPASLGRMEGGEPDNRSTGGPTGSDSDMLSATDGQDRQRQKQSSPKLNSLAGLFSIADGEDGQAGEMSIVVKLSCWVAHQKHRPSTRFVAFARYAKKFVAAAGESRTEPSSL